MQFSGIYLIARQEWVQIFRSRTAMLLFAMLSLALLLAAYAGWQQTSRYNAQRNKYQHEVEARWMNQPDRHPHRVAHYGYLVFREKSPLSFFDGGIESYTGNALFLEAHRQNTVNMSEAGFSNGMLRFGELHIAMVLQLLVPLFIFFIGFASVAALRENSVLKILLGQGISMKTLIWGKTLGIVSVTIVLFGPVLLLITGVWLLAAQAAITADTGWRLLLLAFYYTCFFTACAWVTVTISACCRTARTSLLLLVVIWIGFFVVMPKAAQTIGARLFPAPDKITFEQQLQADLAKEGDSHNPDDPHYAALKNAVLQKYHVTDVKDLPFNYSGYVMAEGERISADIFRKHYDQLIRTYRQQNSVALWLSAVNPYLAIRRLSMSMAGVDMEHYTAFQQQAEKYRYEKIQALNQIHTHEVSQAENSTQRVSRTHWQQQALFQYRAPVLGDVWRGQRVAVVAGIGWVLLGMIVISIVSKKITV